MAEFEDALAKLQALPEVEYAIDLKLSYGKGEWYTYGFSPIIQSEGADLINRDTWKATGTLNSAGAVEGMTHFQDWVKKGYVVPASAGDDAFYGKKNSALAFVGHWMWTPHHEGLGDDLCCSRCRSSATSRRPEWAPGAGASPPRRPRRRRPASCWSSS